MGNLEQNTDLGNGSTHIIG